MVHSVATSGTKVWAAHSKGLTRLDWTSQKAEAEADFLLRNIGLTPDAQFIVGLNAGEEKSVMVVDAETMELRATHVFPKRPSAWAVGGSRLLVADKFGDVFSVGLLDETSILDDKKKLKVAPILGHVSMVLAVAATPERVLTADRDEHIRVSELPRAFVIERFLLGHTSYVAHLALTGNLLLSGGGDRFVVAWDILTGREIARLDVGTALGQADDAKIDVCALSTTSDFAWIAVEGVSQVVKARFPSLDGVEVIDLGAPVLSLSSSESHCIAAGPSGLADVEAGLKVELGEPTDVSKYTQAHLRKTATH